jgi:hypothetical protein
MLDVLRDCPAKMAVAEWHHAVQTLVFDGAHEPLGVGIRVGRQKWGLHDTDCRLA